MPACMHENETSQVMLDHVAVQGVAGPATTLRHISQTRVPSGLLRAA
ncbi:MAG: hypothetical protein ACRDVG_07150 [Jatrophihabitantaceae bacterium]